MMGKFRFILLLLAFSALSATAFAARQGKDMPRMFARWSQTPDTLLLDYGRKFVRQGKYRDALIVYSIVANRSYRSGMSEQERIAATRAYNNIGYIYFYHYFDYQQSFANLQRALRIAEANQQDKNLAYIYLNLGNLYGTLADLQSSDRYFLSKPLEYYRRAFHCAYRAKDYTVMQPIYCNLLLAAYIDNKMPAIEKECKLYKSLSFPSTVVLARYNRLLEKTVALMRSKRYKEVLRYAQLARRAVDTPDTPGRYVYTTMCLETSAYGQMGDKANVLNKLLEVKKLVEGQHFKDLIITTYSQLSAYYASVNQPDRAMYYKMQYLKAKEEFVIDSQVQAAGEMHFLSELQDANDRVKILDAQRRQQFIIIMLCVVLVVLALLSVIHFVHKNRQLRRQQQILYEKMQESLCHTDTVQQTKYQNSKLDESTKADIYTSVQQQLSDTAVICSCDFSLRSLAEKTGYSYADLSQVINEKAGKNFNALLGEYRIREACRRLGDTATYGKLTIEAIATSVGFKSRTNFVAIFKKVTGLTPSEYQRASRLQKDAKND